MTKGRFLFPRRSLYSRKTQRQRQNPIFSRPAQPENSQVFIYFLYPKILLRAAQQHKLKLAKLLMNLAQLSSRSSAPTAGTEKHPVTTHRVAYPKDDFG